MRGRTLAPWRRGVIGLVAFAALAAAAPRPAPAQTVAGRELAAEAARLLQELAQLRGLPAAGSPPRVAVRSREERRRFIAAELKRKYPPARLEAERRAMVAWSLIPPDFDLGRFLTDLILEQAAAYYDPLAKVMVLAPWLPPDEQREALAHELVHLLQDRQMNLDGFLTGTPGQGDAALARQALVEGEAVALTLDRTLRRQGLELGGLPDVAQLQRAIVVSATGPTLGRAPRFLRSLLTFPYARGLGFVHQFRRRHPWADFSRLYTDPPRSTTQILYPERYLDRREDPVAIGLPDLGPIIGARARRLFEDTAGEFGLAGILAQFLGEDVAATGWSGDRYELWADGGGRTLLVSLTLWTTEAAAAAFADAYARLLPRKHGLAAAADTARGLVAWRLGDQAFSVERRGREVLLVERALMPVDEAIRRAVWQSRRATGARDTGSAVTERRPG